jgi:cytochrome c biogenesis protein CcmG/thiol:disulfide interchange protein DsbE
MPLLQSAAAANRGRIVFLGIDSNDTDPSALAFLRQVRVTYPSAVDANGSTAIAYGLFGLPTTVFVSSSGTIIGRHVGQLSQSSLELSLRQAFGRSGS